MKANLKVFVRKNRTVIVLIVVFLALIVLPNVEVAKLQFIENQDPCLSWAWGRPYYSDVHWYWDWFHSYDEYGQCGQSKIEAWIHIEQVGDIIPILNLRPYGDRAKWELIFFHR
ncbi:hypothetical protein KBC75_01755 [Candidatus Shapirobacteria bacterium]|nr:hypothetical protein [Candidatus Shapirobacteria bacterium]